MWTQLALSIVFGVISYLLTPKPPVSTPTAANEVSGVPEAKAGDEIPMIYGTAWLTRPQVGWHGDMKTAPIKTRGSKK